MKKLFNNKYIVAFIMAFISYLSFLIYFKDIFSNDSFNLMYTLLFFFLYYFYYVELGRSKNKLGKIEKNSIILVSFILSFCLVVGSIVSSYLGDIAGTIFNFHNILYCFVGIVGYMLFFYFVIRKFVSLTNKLKIKGKGNFGGKDFFKFVLLFLLAWLPYFLRYFPAVMTPDSYYSIENVSNFILSDYHTFGHTWFFGAFFLLGKLLFGNLNLAVGFYIVIQMIINAIVFTFVVRFLYVKNVNKILKWVIILFMLLSPLYAIYSVTLWRDILFGCSFILLMLSLYDYVDNNYKLSKFNVSMYLVATLIILFFRNNGIYVFILLVPCLVLFSKYNKKILAISNIIIIVLYFVIKGPVFDYFSIAKSTSSEAYSIPLQQISRVVVSGLEIDAKDYKYLNTVIDMKKISKEYSPTISDPVKRLVDNKNLNKSKSKFFKVWFKLFLRHPRTYIEAYLCQTLGYWYPDVVYWASGGESKSIFKDINVYSEPVIHDTNNLFGAITSRKLPLSNLIWSLGTMFILLMFSMFLVFYRKNYRYLLCYMPLVCLWFTLMVATPVFCELRYVYGLFVCMPLMVVIPFVKKNV